jgi:hypothetical protein
MGQEQAAKLRSSLRLVLMHLLKWKYQSPMRTPSWRITIGRERRNIRRHLKENPGLKHRLTDLFDEAFEDARKDAADETGLPLAVFPTAAPFTIEQTRDENFWPE